MTGQGALRLETSVSAVVGLKRSSTAVFTSAPTYCQELLRSVGRVLLAFSSRFNRFNG